MVSPCVFIGVCSRFRLAVVQGPEGFPTRRTRALRRTVRISCTRAACVDPNIVMHHMEQIY